jgi:hypothetical protein
MRYSSSTQPIDDRWKLLFTLLAVFLATPRSLLAGDFSQRDDCNAVLEPAGTTINGAGPTPDAFANYWNLMGEGNKPMVYMDYVGLRDLQSNWPANLQAELLKYQPMFVIPQIGLSMTRDGYPDQHYEDEVAAGSLDYAIHAFLDQLEELALPVYLRIGYEFNGSGWNGYRPDTYIQAFRRITQMIRERGLEVATVWDAAAGGDINYYDYYPGDEYVDWWGMNTFQPQHFGNMHVLGFLNNAAMHHKPVMIGESTPSGTGVLDGQVSWYNWFVPYFQFIHSHPGIKMFCYINFNWTEYPQWADWGDCRLEMNAYVGQHFADEMCSPLYMHAGSEQGFRRTLGYDDTVAPPTITNLHSYDSVSPVSIEWGEVVDPSGLAHYIVYRDSSIAGYTPLPRFESSDVIAGSFVDYCVTAMDRAGNESPMSEPVTVAVPNVVPKTVNGEFDDDFDGWNRDVWGGSADFGIDTSSAISGTKAARVSITSSSGTNWHIQLRQPMKIHKGMKYNISYKAKANKNVTLQTCLQVGHEPFTNYIQQSVFLAPEVRSFAHTVTANADDDVYLAFMMGALGQAEVWIDAVSVTEQKTGPGR